MNAADQSQVDKAANREEQRRARELADLDWVMADKRGRRVLNRILGVADVFGEVFHTNGSITNLNLGKRKVGLFIYAELEQACPEKILTMRQEYIKENPDVD